MARRRRGGLGLLSILIWAAFLFAGARYVESIFDDGLRRPQVKQPREAAATRRRPGRALPRPSVLDPTAEVEMAPCAEACTGSAFAIDDRGHWLTAQHVVDDCRQIGLLRGTRAIKVTKVLSHPRADVSMLWTDSQVPPLALASDGLRLGQDGFHFGFPRSEPGAVHGRLLGRLNLRATGQHRFVAPGISWAEQARRPDREGGLGGLSGGAVLDDRGEVIGVTVAASQRRGRVISAAPATLVEMIEYAGLTRAELPDRSSAPRSIDGRDFERVGADLRRKLTVAQVLCVGRTAKRRRSLF